MKSGAVALLGVTLSVISAHAQLAESLRVNRGAQDPSVSPDGSQIAVALLGSIWLVPIDGGAARRITHGDGWTGHPVWSHDGRFLVYSHQRPGRKYAPEFAKDPRTELVMHNLSTNGVRTVYTTNHAIAQIAFHPTQSKLVFIQQQGQFEAQLWSVRVDGDSATQLTHGDDRAVWSFALSPDGERAAVEHVHRGASDLYIVRLDSLDIERLTRTASEQFAVNWSADGGELVYIDRDNGIEHVTVRSLENGSTQRIFTSPYDGKQLTLHPDGESAVLVAGRQLYRLDLGNGDASPILLEASFERPTRAPGTLVVGNARLFDATHDGVRELAHVAARDGRITRVWSGPIVPSDTAGIDFIDAGGRFLMPGLMDSHFHYWPFFVHYGSAALMKGITAARDPGAEIRATLNLREAIRLGVIEGPEMYVLGPLIDGPVGYHPMVDVLIDEPGAGASLVRSLHALGVDGVKVYHSLAPDVVRAVVSEARAVGLPVSADLGCITRWEIAIDAGVTGLNHAHGYRFSHLPDELQPCREGEPWAVESARYKLQEHTPVDPDRPELHALFRRMVDRDAYFDPTVKVFEMTDSARAELGLDRVVESRETFAAYLEIIRIAHEEGVTLLAGTDGANLFDELETYEKAGLPNDVILRMASVNGARWLGKEGEFGTVEVGKRAHLLLVDGDPLTEIKALRNTRLVVKDGRIVFDGR